MALYAEMVMTMMKMVKMMRMMKMMMIMMKKMKKEEVIVLLAAAGGIRRGKYSDLIRHVLN